VRGVLRGGGRGVRPGTGRGAARGSWRGPGRDGARRLAAVAAVAVSILVAGCAAPAAPSLAPGTVRVVATTTILADLVRQVGGTRVSVTSLVPKGGDVHTFDPRPSSLRAVTQADLVIRNGLGLDDWLAALVRNTGTAATVVAAAENLPGVTYLAGTGAEGAVNPHVWLNPLYAAAMADRIAAALATADPADAASFIAGATAYRAVLVTLDADARARLAAIPAGRRTVIAFHDAFPYFAAAYGLVIDGTVVASPGQDPSAGTMAHLVDVVRADGVRAIFTEAQFNDELARTIAAETGLKVVSNLYTDTVGDAPLDTYAAVMRWNVDRVTGALEGS
jgi:manganese/iron transport system substrate-binding protein